MKKILPIIFLGIFTLTVIAAAHAQTADNLLQSENVFDTLSVDLKVNGSDGPVDIAVGSRITLSWISEEATRCKASWARNDVPLTGTVTGKVSKSALVKIACINADGERADDAVRVNALNPSQADVPLVQPPSQPSQPVRVDAVKRFAPSSSSRNSVSSGNVGVSKPVQLADDAARVVSLNREIINILEHNLETRIPGIRERLEKDLKTRFQLLQGLVKEHTAVFLTLTTLSSYRERVSPELKEFLEEKVVIPRATADVQHIDDFDFPQNSSFSYTLTVSGKDFQFYPTSFLGIPSNSVLSVSSAVRLGGLLAASGGENIKPISVPPPDALGDQRTLVLLIDFTDSPPRPATKEEIYSAVFEGEFQKFMKEQSFGRTSFSGVVSDWIAIPRKGDPASCVSGVYSNDPVIQDYLASNFPVFDFDRIIFATNHSNPGCSGVGKGKVEIGKQTHLASLTWVGILSKYNEPSGWGPDYFNWTNLDYLLAHEVGHGLGVLHANGWDCGTEILYGDCKHIEYGNYFDLMGSGGGYSLHFSAFFKELLGWLPPARILTISASGNYRLSPFESAEGVVAAKVVSPFGDYSPYYLEWRNAIGYDSRLRESEFSGNQKGLLVTLLSKRRNAPWLLDMNPTLPFSVWYADAKDAALTGKKVFNDSGRGAAFGPILSVGEKDIAFSVELSAAQCRRKESILKQAIPPEKKPIEIIAGNSFYLVADFFNKDTEGCGPGMFSLAGSFPESWPRSSLRERIDGNFQVNSEEQGWFGWGFTVPPDATPGVYTVHYDLKNGDRIAAGRDVPVTVKNPPRFTSIVPSRGPVGTKVLLVSSDSLEPGEIFLEFSNRTAVGSLSLQHQGGTKLTFTVPSVLWQSTLTLPGVYKIELFSTSLESMGVFSFEVLPSASVSSSTSFIRISRATLQGTFFQPRELVIGKITQTLGSFDIITSEAAQLSPPTFRLAVSGDPNALNDMHSFELWQLDPIKKIGTSKFSDARDTIVFRDVLDLRSGKTTFTIIASPGSRFVPGQKLTLSANFWKDDVVAATIATPSRGLSFPKNEVIINTLLLTATTPISMLVPAPSGMDAPRSFSTNRSSQFASPFFSNVQRLFQQWLGEGE